jgi:putative intracellular protease/amidase
MQIASFPLAVRSGFPGNRGLCRRFNALAWGKRQLAWPGTLPAASIRLSGETGNDSRARGRTLTSWPSLKTDIGNVGGNWVDAEVQVCTSGPNVLVTSRKPDDLPAFCRQLRSEFQRQG